MVYVSIRDFVNYRVYVIKKLTILIFARFSGKGEFSCANWILRGTLDLEKTGCSH